MRKKLLSVLMIIALTTSMAGCSSNESVSKNGVQPTNEPTQLIETNRPETATEKPESTTGFGDDLLSGDLWEDDSPEVSENNDELKELFDSWASADGSGIEIHGYNGTEAVVEIPAEIDGLPVVSIDGFTNNQDITEVIIPDTVKVIGEKAFFLCEKLEKITIGKGVEVIEYYGIAKCSKLTSITLNEGLKELNDFAIVSNDGLKEVYFFGTEVKIGPVNFSPDVSIHGKKGSTAETYANENGLTFVAIN